MKYGELRNKARQQADVTNTGDQEALIRHVKAEMDQAFTDFGREMAKRVYSGPFESVNWAPPVYTRRQRIARWSRKKIRNARQRIALWFAPWLENSDYDY